MGWVGLVLALLQEVLQNELTALLPKIPRIPWSDTAKINTSDACGLMATSQLFSLHLPLQWGSQRQESTPVCFQWPWPQIIQSLPFQILNAYLEFQAKLLSGSYSKIHQHKFKGGWDFSITSENQTSLLPRTL